jgi:hypothetical protein
MIRIRKLARTIIRTTMDEAVFEAHLVYIANMLMDAMDHLRDIAMKPAVPVGDVKLQLDGCLGTGWGKGVKLESHSFIRHFELEYAVRKSAAPACK